MFYCPICFTSLVFKPASNEYDRSLYFCPKNGSHETSCYKIGLDPKSNLPYYDGFRIGSFNIERFSSERCSPNGATRIEEYLDYSRFKRHAELYYVLPFSSFRSLEKIKQLLLLYSIIQ